MSRNRSAYVVPGGNREGGRLSVKGDMIRQRPSADNRPGGLKSARNVAENGRGGPVVYGFLSRVP